MCSRKLFVYKILIFPDNEINTIETKPDYRFIKSKIDKSKFDKSKFDKWRKYVYTVRKVISDKRWLSALC